VSDQPGMPSAPAGATVTDDDRAPAGVEPVVARTREELHVARRALTDGDVAVVMTMGALHEGHATLTNPTEAEDFVKRTGCDSLACAIGTSHGAFKFKGKQSLHFDVLEGIKSLLPNFPLVMHGSSSVPKDEVDRINAAGGTIKDSAGVNIDEYLPAAKLGVTKINIDTDGRLVWTRVHREFFRDKPSDFDFRPPGKIFIQEYAKFIASRNEKLGSAGTLSEVRASLAKK